MAEIRPKIASMITKIGPEHLIAIQTAPTADYNTYFELQNEIAAAYREVRKTLKDFPQRIADVIEN